jgi:penicillin-binding protein 1C
MARARRAGRGGVGFWSLAPRPLFKSPLSAVLEARDGTLLSARIAADGQWRFPELAARATEVSRRRCSGTRTSASSRTSRGCDPLGRARARNWRARRVVSGASTHHDATRAAGRAAAIERRGGRPRRNLWSKGVEALLALRIEAGYQGGAARAVCEHAPFGGNVVGLEAAAWRYFGRQPDQL